MSRNTKGSRDACNQVEQLESRRMLSVELVKDVSPLTAAAGPNNFVDLNGVVYFAADAGGGDAGVGREMYRSDGTSAGTRLAFDLYPGPVPSSPADMTRLGSNILFVGQSGRSTGGLWRTDGTAAGTVLLKSIAVPGYPTELHLTIAVSGGLAYFSAQQPDGSYWLWRTDGTVGGTIPLAQASPSYMTDVNGTLYFANSTSAAGSELWKSDGTPAGTAMVKDLVAGTAGSKPTQLTNVNGVLYFVGQFDLSSRFIGRSDGTAAGTSAVYLAGITEPGPLASFAGTLFFSFPTGTGLWKVTGNTATQVSPLTTGGYPTYADHLTVVGSKLMFSGGGALWRSDGTTAGTVPVDTAGTRAPAKPINFVSANGTLYFSANDGSHGWELYRSDGTAAGTALVKDANPGPASSVDSYDYGGYHGFVASGGALYYSGTDGVAGRELFRSDGTAAGTGTVRDLNVTPVPSDPQGLVAAGGLVYFQEDDGIHGLATWVSDGSAAGTSLLTTATRKLTSNYYKDVVKVGGLAYFVGADDKLYATDGTPAGTFAFTRDPSVPSATYRQPRGVVDLDGTPILLADASDYSYGLWRADPASHTLSPLTPAVNRAESIDNPVVVGHRVLFFFGGPEGAELWVSDGTPAGTKILKDILPGPAGSAPVFLGVAGDRLYFYVSEVGMGNELWMSDGTAAGTVRVDNALPGGDGGSTGQAEFTVAAGGTTFFTATDPAHGRELWKMTPTGAVLVKDIYPGAGDSWVAGLTAVGDVLTFWATESTGGRELWRSDGTAAGTVRVRDIAPGWASSISSTTTAPPHAVSGGLLFFAASDGQGGVELYQSDGTAGGTVRVQDLYPGATGSDPQSLADLGGTVTFLATDPTYGRELWKYRDATAPLAGPAGFDPSTGAARVSFSENVSGSIADGDVTLVDRTTGQTLPSSAWSRSYDLNTNTLTITFAAPPADGDYRLVVAGAGVTDPSGNALAQDVTFDFFVLAGDANRDRTVNFTDLLAVARNYNKTGTTWADGDFDGNGTVNFNDLLTLARNYNKTLPAAGAVLAPAATIDVGALAAAMGIAAPTTSPTKPTPPPAPAKRPPASPKLAPKPTPVIRAVTPAAPKAPSVLRDDDKANPVFSTTRVVKPAPVKSKAVAKAKGR